LKKLYIWPLGDVNSSLNPGVNARTHGSEVTRLGVTDLSSEIPNRAQQDILGGVDVIDTSKPQILASDVWLMSRRRGATHRSIGDSVKVKASEFS
jgi:hypothetical protein